MAETESLMTSVERLLHYTKNIKSEAPQIIPTNRPPPEWPDKGEITYKDVFFFFFNFFNQNNKKNQIN
jgi:hypothetical protein